MALVLRKAILAKNASLLKCLKGRPLATVTNKKSSAPISSAVPWRSLARQPLPLGTLSVKKVKQLFLERTRRASKFTPVRFCMSCPNLVPASRIRPRIRRRHLSAPRAGPVRKDFLHLHSKRLAPPRNAMNASCSELLHARTGLACSTRSYSKPCACGCPCPPPCGPYGCPGGCGCLPPPCNQPPRCLQYITGYYYYPYGTWFCGPYHVTGTCYPVGASGPCAPCGPCGPCGPCPKCCPAPACVCPAAAAVVAPAAAPSPAASQAPKPASAPPNTMNSPLNAPINNTFSAPKAQTHPRSNISKYFPFNASAGAAQPSAKSEAKPKRPQSFKTMSFWPYSTVATSAPDCQRRSISTQSPYTTFQCPRYGKDDRPTVRSDCCPEAEYHLKSKGNMSPIRHKKHKYICQMRPQSIKPKSRLTELWDTPFAPVGVDNYVIPSGIRVEPWH